MLDVGGLDGSCGVLVRASANAGKPTLGICFGHQLLCHALGATIERAESLSSGIWDLNLTDDGENDELLTSHVSDDSIVAGLFTARSCYVRARVLFTPMLNQT